MLKYISTLLLAFSSAVLFGQGWERIYTGGAQDEARGVAITPDGGYILTGSYNSNNLLLIKVDVDGFQQWTKLNLSNLSQGNAVAVTADTSYLIAGRLATSNNPNTWDALLLKTDQHGNLIWKKNLGITGEDLFNDMKILPDGSIIAVGTALIAGDYAARVVKADADGNLIWSKTYGLGNTDEFGKKIALAANGDFFVVGDRKTNPSTIYGVRINGDGDIIWENTFNVTNGVENSGESAVFTPGGDILIVGRTLLPTSSYSRGFVMKIYGDEVPLPLKWVKTIDEAEVNYGVNLTSDSNYLICGQTPVVPGELQGERLFIAKIDASGDYIWKNAVGKQGPSTGYAVAEATNGGAVSIGFTKPSANPNVTPYYSYMARTDENGNIYTNYLSGKLFNDQNGDCEYQSGDSNIKGWLLKIASPTFTRYVTTNAQGNYFVMVDTGIYDVQVYTPNAYWSTCESNITIPVLDFYDTLTTDIGVKNALSCPYNEVDIQTPILRRCTDNVYTVRYCNSGTIPSLNTQVYVEKSEFLDITSTSIPFVPVGDSLRFNVGTVNPGDCNSFTITAFLQCDVDLVSAHCMRAHITPDSICGVTGWDGSIIEAKAICQNDTVKLSLVNKGMGPNADELGFVIIEDVIVLFTPNNTINTLLPGADTLVFSRPANGKTYRIIAEQSNTYPGMSVPTAAIEGCKTDTTISVSTGFYTMFPEDDNDPNDAVDCQEAFETDFNPTFLKRGHPKGYQDPHFIKPDTEVDYLIRFQNTGTDTVLQVVVRDTLSPWLDPASVRAGTASHPYTFSVYGDGIIQFQLTNINLLPQGSGVSEGYVKFRVSQKPEVPCGSEIFNRAAIFFDNNAPVVTNETFHTVCDSFVEVTSQSKEVHFPGADLRVYPNPFVESVTFEVTGVQAKTYQLEIFDGSGNLLFNQIHSDSTFRLFKRQIPTGVLFYRLAADGRPVVSGKLMAL